MKPTVWIWPFMKLNKPVDIQVVFYKMQMFCKLYDIWRKSETLLSFHIYALNDPKALIWILLKYITGWGQIIKKKHEKINETKHSGGGFWGESSLKFEDI